MIKRQVRGQFARTHLLSELSSTYFFLFWPTVFRNYLDKSSYVHGVKRICGYAPMHCGTKLGHFETSNHSFSNELRSERASERISAADWSKLTNELSRPEQANEGMDEQVAQYLPFHGYSEPLCHGVTFMCVQVGA